MKTEQVKITQIKTNSANPRSITGDKFNRLVDSILVFPKMLELRPIVVDSTMVALGGNQRKQALLAISKMTPTARRPKVSVSSSLSGGASGSPSLSPTSSTPPTSPRRSASSSSSRTTCPSAHGTMTSSPTTGITRSSATGAWTYGTQTQWPSSRWEPPTHSRDTRTPHHHLLRMTVLECRYRVWTTFLQSCRGKTSTPTICRRSKAMTARLPSV